MTKHIGPFSVNTGRLVVTVIQIGAAWALLGWRAAIVVAIISIRVEE